MKRRVVITGLGIVSPVGTGVDKAWDALCRGKSGIDYITKFDASSFPVKIAGEVKDFDPLCFIEKKEIKKMDPFIQFALAASIMAVEDANLKIDESIAERVGVIVGAGLGGLSTIEKYHSILLDEGYRKISPFFVPMLIINLASGQISIHFGAKGPNLSSVTACATGNHCIGDAFKLIQRGDADVMIAGGTESTITPLALGGFIAMKALSTYNGEPAKASRPFDKNRDGFVLAEGAGICVLEEMDFALERGATIYAEILGYGLNCDAYHISAPSPEGEGARKCMELALKDAGLRPQEIHYINAHGTSTQYNDLCETMAIKKVFREHSKELAISSSKSMTGHALGGAGGIEAVFTVLSIYQQIIPPTINYETPDPLCDLDYVPNVARRAPIKVALSNSFGFGGANATLVFKKFEP